MVSEQWLCANRFWAFLPSFHLNVTKHLSTWTELFRIYKIQHVCWSWSLVRSGAKMRWQHMQISLVRFVLFLYWICSSAYLLHTTKVHWNSENVICFNDCNSSFAVFNLIKWVICPVFKVLEYWMPFSKYFLFYLDKTNYSSCKPIQNKTIKSTRNIRQ